MSSAPPHGDTQPIPVVQVPRNEQAAPVGPGRHAAPRTGRSLGRWSLVVAREVGIVAAAVVVVAIAARLLLGQVVYVADDAMAPAFAPGERVLVSPWGEAGVDDVVLVETAPAWGAPKVGSLVRVAAVGGQRIACCDDDGRITVDGVSRDEPFARGATDQVEFDVLVPEGRVFVLADDRSTARDSRALLDVEQGTVDVDDILGRVVTVVWPPRVLRK
ncbi:MAG: signal peptidase I [Candidatus Nanopelagicales bacterium]|jgi:signal peptidase I